MLTASGDKTVALWDISRKDAGAVSVFKGHTATVKVIASAPDSNRKLTNNTKSMLQVLLHYRSFYFWIKRWKNMCVGHAY